MVSLVVAGAIFAYVLGSAADVSGVGAAISSMTGGELVTLALVALWNLVTYGLVVVASTPGLTCPQAMVLVESTNQFEGGCVTYGFDFDRRDERW